MRVLLKRFKEAFGIFHAATGVFPVPPTERFPMLRTGIENSAARKIRQS